VRQTGFAANGEAMNAGWRRGAIASRTALGAGRRQVKLSADDADWWPARPSVGEVRM